jgi:hypothetical protein
MGTCYCTIDDVKAKLNIVDATRDAEILQAIEAVSADIEGPDPGANRAFATRCAISYLEWDGLDAANLWCGDVLSASALAEDTAGDWTYATAWTVTTDYLLLPDDRFPRRRIMPVGTKAFTKGARRYRLTGVLGYGDGLSASPWKSAGVTGTVATADGITVALSGAMTTIKAGHTVRLNDEQMFVRAIPTTSSLTVDRAQNGTTGATHTTAATVYIAQYPAIVTRTAIWLACEWMNMAAQAGIANMQASNQRFSYAATKPEQIRRMLASVRRGAIIGNRQ